MLAAWRQRVGSVLVALLIGGPPPGHNPLFGRALSHSWTLAARPNRFALRLGLPAAVRASGACHTRRLGSVLRSSMSNPERQVRNVGWPVWGGLALVDPAGGVSIGGTQIPGGFHPAAAGLWADCRLHADQPGRPHRVAGRPARARGVADIIFTRCPGPCLKMTRQMKELQDALPPAARPNW